MARIMDAKRMVELLNSTLNVSAGPADFSHPTPARVQEICGAFIMHVFEVPEQALLHLPLLAMQGSEDNPEDFQRSAHLIMIYSTMVQFTTDMQMDIDFSMCDLISPEPKKFRHLMSCLCDYLNLHKNLMPHWQETCAIYDVKRQRLAHLQQVIEEVSTKRDSLVAEKDARKRREHELMGKLGKKQSELQNYFAKTQELESAYETNKKITENNKFTQEELRVERESLQMQLEQLSLQLLGSPERVLKDLDHYKEELASSREQEEKQRKHNEDIKNQLAVAHLVGQYIEKTGGEVEQKILKSRADLDQIHMVRMDAHQMHREAERRLQAVTNEIQAAEEEIIKCDENMVRDRRMHQERMEELDSHRKQLEEELVQIKKSNASPAAERLIQGEMTAVRAMRSEVINNTKIFMENTTQEYAKLLRNMGQENVCYEEESRNYGQIVKDLEKDAQPPSDLNETANQSLRMLM